MILSPINDFISNLVFSIRLGEASVANNLLIVTLADLSRYSIPVEKIEDTMVQALAHSLPGGLDKLCDVMGVSKDDAKDKAE